MNHMVIAWQLRWSGTCRRPCPKQHCAVALYLSPFDNPASVFSGYHRVSSEHFFIQCHIGYTIIRKLFFIVLMGTSVHFIFQISGMGVTWGEKC